MLLSTATQCLPRRLLLRGLASTAGHQPQVSKGVWTCCSTDGHWPVRHNSSFAFGVASCPGHCSRVSSHDCLRHRQVPTTDPLPCASCF